jgi:hypothetical protein
MALAAAALAAPLIPACLGRSAEAISWQLFPGGEGHYNYAPTAIEEPTAHHFWWCRNAEPWVIVDYVYYSRWEVAEKRWTPPAQALAPGEPGQWDRVHVCDPAVVRGEFRYRGRAFAYAMLYLGTDDTACKHNQVGLALAADPAGPWTRFGANPIVAGSAATWGSGQPSVISLDRRGRLLVFYTQQEADLSTHTYLREANLRDLDHPVIGHPVRLPTDGLTERGPGPVILNNADFALEPVSGDIVVVRPQHPNAFLQPGENPGISSHLQVARIPARGLRRGGGRWRPVAAIGPENTGYAHNHNACLGRDAYGRLPDPHRLRVSLSVAGRVPDSLWTYTLHGIVLDMP